MMPKPILALFLTGVGVWLPEVLWAVTQGLIAGWDDPKFGTYGGLAFAAVFGSMVAFPAGLVALFVYAIKEQASEMLSERAKYLVPFATGIALAPIRYYLETRGFPILLPSWLPELPLLIAVWCLTSLLGSWLALTVYFHSAANPPLNTDAPPDGGAPVS